MNVNVYRCSSRRNQSDFSSSTEQSEKSSTRRPPGSAGQRQQPRGPTICCGSVNEAICSCVWKVNAQQIASTLQFCYTKRDAELPCKRVLRSPLRSDVTFNTAAGVPTIPACS